MVRRFSGGRSYPAHDRSETVNDSAQLSRCRGPDFIFRWEVAATLAHETAAVQGFEAAGLRRLSVAIGLACSAFGATIAHALDQGPVLVVPGRPGIPVIINGYDASYTIVEGDWGLARPGQVAPAIVNGPLIRPAPYYTGPYYPKVGRRPGYGRREYDPPEQHRQGPAPSYYRQWGIESQPTPATIPPDYPQTPLIVAPTINTGGRRPQPRPRPR